MARKGRAKALPPKMLTVYGDIVQETEDAILLKVEGEEHWLPKSRIEYIGERGDTDVEVSMPDWLAEDMGLSDGIRPHQCAKCGMVSKKRKCPGCGCSVFKKL